MTSITHFTPRMSLRRISRFVALSSLAVIALSSREASAQAPKPIGLIKGGTVLLESKSVKRDGGIITAPLRVQFHKPTKVPGGNWYSSRTLLLLDCRKQVVAVKENWYYSDAKGTKVAQHKEVGIPGYATPLPGSMPKVALDHLCQTK
ncbi:surface-adhesin E family protein [Gemmatimonas groenlandica]|uniref:Surface-adhesin protein E-like domain-containing protein n=1 Tax=Gemmatimonas groenlandica TaxID=2732249 RepID=A0A6M4ITH7_9BACT|nr:surface-adhesin E family protein [Gemmatimonas groenlandica]QJR37428.1 hypothetical protein HKW67_18890 [Gemmatimonas groenlandica]